MLCYVMLCYVMLCYVMLCYVMLNLAFNIFVYAELSSITSPSISRLRCVIMVRCVVLDQFLCIPLYSDVLLLCCVVLCYVVMCFVSFMFVAQ